MSFPRSNNGNPLLGLGEGWPTDTRRFVYFLWMYQQLQELAIDASLTNYHANKMAKAAMSVRLPKPGTCRALNATRYRTRLPNRPYLSSHPPLCHTDLSCSVVPWGALEGTRPAIMLAIGQVSGRAWDWIPWAIRDHSISKQAAAVLARSPQIAATPHSCWPSTVQV